MKTKKLIYLFTLLNVFILSLTVFAASSLVTINGKDVMDKSSFEKQYDGFITLQAFTQPMGIFASPERIKETKDNDDYKELFLSNLVNDLIIEYYAKEKGLYNKSKVEEQTKAMSEIIRRMIIKQIFIQKEILANAPKDVDSKVKAEIYKQIEKNPNYKKLSQGDKRTMAKEQAKAQMLQKNYILSIDKLRSKYKVVIDD